MADMTRERKEAQEALAEIKEDYWEDDGHGNLTQWCQCVLNSIDLAISDMKRVEDLYGYVDDAIGAEKRMMGRILDLASEEYHKGIIYALERMKMKLME